MPLRQVVNDYLSDYHHRESGIRRVYTIQDARVVQLNARFRLEARSHRTRPGDIAAEFGAGTLTFGEVDPLLGQLDEGLTDHLQIKANPQWQAFYLVADRDVATLDRAGGAGTASKSSVPCWKCRVLLPLDCIHIDHSRPQAGGQIEAIAKVLRALGLTQGAPRGAKSVAFAGAAGAAASSLSQRYTLSDRGTTFFTLLNRVGEQRPEVMPEVSRLCLNHYINLRPLCPGCNIRRGAPLRFDHMAF